MIRARLHRIIVLVGLDIVCSLSLLLPFPDTLALPCWCKKRQSTKRLVMLVLTQQTGADNCEAGDTTQQFRLPWYGTPGGDPSQQGRVFVKPGVSCNTLCDDYTLGKDGCKAVKELDSCL